MILKIHIYIKKKKCDSYMLKKHSIFRDWVGGISIIWFKENLYPKLSMCFFT
jgi:hypothetical protein